MAIADSPLLVDTERATVAALLRVARRVQRQGARVARARGRGFQPADLRTLYRLRAMLVAWNAALERHASSADLVMADANRRHLSGPLAEDIALVEGLRRGRVA